ncbi:MAG TPA: tripartite tricarboxylate transporter substrate binding protein [Ramlibacter sp.]|uniref:Bug family tripartite tricarboxylate transporter substrate binding protein n=1 Tax=Ramlibacter sp. TaxID=1917967 RepID=UPI002B601C51|nr:tripartite tricarboxylate transporter substrate binding protein [Ramlibacter sp.]HVZ44489.1 tripartite tricarboxylate transporter substrate binding protein [Ramlibacter sp.]
MNGVKRRDVLICAAASAILPAYAAFPSRLLRIVVPFGPGGIADLTVRTVGEALGKRIGQSVVVDNRPGAGGVTAGDIVAHAEPDGHTLLLVSNGTAVSAGLFSKLPFDPVKDFVPVSLIGTFDIAIVVAENSKLHTLADLLAAAKANPGKLNIATVNVGSTQHLAAELFMTAAGIRAQVVPFNGTPAVVTALRGGEVDAAVEILGPLQSQLDAKALRALAVMGGKRPGGMPQVPTVAESGGALRGFDVSSWNGLAAPAKTPREVVQRLHAELEAVLADPAVRQRLAALSVEARSSTPEQLGALLASEIRRWSDVIARAGIPRQ